MGKFHFIGSITYSGIESQPVEVRPLQLTDGQQRITSIMLLLRALKETSGVSDELGPKIDQLLFNIGEKKNGSDYHKLILAGDDYQIFKGIMEDGKTDASGNLPACFNHFRKQLTNDREQPNLIWKGLHGLTAVSILLEKDDDAQGIFESMNSTGLELSTTDLIQNYMLMGMEQEQQHRIYEKYWRPMEKQFGEHAVVPDTFFRCYISMRKKEAVRKGDVYKRFKEYMEDRDREEEIKEIFKHFGHYKELKIQSSSHPLRKEIEYACNQYTDVADSLLLKVMVDYANGTIGASDAKQVFVLIGSYLLRSRVCDTLTGANKSLPNLIAVIDERLYVESICKTLVSKKGAGRFPRNDVFKDSLKRLPLYTNAVCKYVLVKLNTNPKEIADPDELEIEHIMPQQPDDAWKKDLGEKWEEIHERYIHTIGNLTLTGYNLDLKNFSFRRKRPKYGNSAIAMTRNLACLEMWGEREITERANDLAERAVSVWQYPSEYEGQTVPEKEEYGYDRTLEDYYLEGKNTVKLWNSLKSEILSACPGIVFHMNKHYGTFRLPTSRSAGVQGICAMESLLNRIYVTYYTKIDDGVIVLSDFVRDVSKVGHSSPGEIRVTVASEDDLEKAVILVKDVWNARLRSLG